MAKKQKSLLPPSPEAHANLLSVIRSSPVPLMARSLAKLLEAPYEILEADLISILDEHVVAGRLYRYPPKTLTSKPRFWDRDALALNRAAALDAIHCADGPLTSRELLKRMVVPLKLTASELTEILNQYVLAGTLHVLPPATAKSQARYWHSDALEFGRRAILRALEAKGQQVEARLKKEVKGLSDSQFQQIVQDAIAARAIWRHPPLGKTKKQLLGIRPPSPEPYLRQIGTQLTTVIAQLTAVNVAPEELRRALVQMIEAAGIPFANTSASIATNVAVSPPPTIDLIGLMRRLEPGADRGALVGSRDLRRAAQVDKLAFDRAVLELAQQGRLSLHRHDYAASLSPAERDELVTDGAGAFYVGMALRQNAG